MFRQYLAAKRINLAETDSPESGPVGCDSEASNTAK
jgi:hypothetical protein